MASVILCDECKKNPANESFACEGAMASERSQTLGPVDTTLLLSCTCCDQCRMKCLDSFIEQIQEEEKDGQLR